MTEFSNGEYQTDSVEVILDAMVDDAKAYWDEDLKDDDLAVLRLFYRPIAEFLATVQEDLALVLQSSQIDNATGAGLNLLTALIGVEREPATVADGQVTFSRDTPAGEDYQIPKGQLVQTNSNDPVEYETTDSSVILGPKTSSDTTTYSTSNTALVTKTSFTVDVTHRETVDVSADFRTTNSSYTAYLEIADATNATAISNNSTTSTSLVTDGPTTYDVSALSGDITFEYRIRTGNSSGTTELTNSTADKGGETATVAPIEAAKSGAGGNSAINTLVVMPTKPVGVDDVTNNAEIAGGSDKEDDEELRTRAKEELGDGSRASAPALISTLRGVEDVTSVSIFINDTNNDNTGTGGLPDHAFEMVVSGGSDASVGQALLNTKAAGDTSYSGANGTSTTVTSDLGNGQTHDISFSRPSSIQIYVDADLDVTDDFVGLDEVKENIVEYIGGILPSGQEDNGRLGVGDDTIYGEVEYAIRSAKGVYDVPSLAIGTSASPTGTTNISIADSEIASSDGTDGSLTFTTTTVSK